MFFVRIKSHIDHITCYKDKEFQIQGNKPVRGASENSFFLRPYGPRLLPPFLSFLFAHAFPHNRSLSLGIFRAHPFSGSHREHPEPVRFGGHLGNGYCCSFQQFNVTVQCSSNHVSRVTHDVTSDVRWKLALRQNVIRVSLVQTKLYSFLGIILIKFYEFIKSFDKDSPGFLKEVLRFC